MLHQVVHNYFYQWKVMVVSFQPRSLSEVTLTFVSANTLPPSYQISRARIFLRFIDGALNCFRSWCIFTSLAKAFVATAWRVYIRSMAGMPSLCLTSVKITHSHQEDGLSLWPSAGSRSIDRLRLRRCCHDPQTLVQYSPHLETFRTNARNWVSTNIWVLKSRMLLWLSFHLLC